MALREKQFYRPDELAVFIDVSKETVYRWMRLGIIQGIQVGNSKKIPADEYKRVATEGVPKGRVTQKAELDEAAASKYETCVYLVKWRELYKIGISSSLKTRMRSLYDIVPGPLELVGIIRSRDHRLLESELHEKYSKHRHHGEWFKLPNDKLLEITKRKDFIGLRVSVGQFLEII